MKKLFSPLLALALVAMAATAHATPQKPPPVKPEPAAEPAQLTSTVDVNNFIAVDLDAKAKAEAAAAAAAKAKAEATGGTGIGTGGTAAAEANAAPVDVNVEDNSKQSNKVYVAPPPVFATNPTSNGCIVNESWAAAVGWSFISGAHAVQKSDRVCTNLKLADMLTRTCQFKSAAQVRNDTYAFLNPGTTALEVPAGETNMTAAACAIHTSAVKFVPAPGPAGPAGPAGAAGKDGKDGAQGPKGDRGPRGHGAPPPCLQACVNCCKT